MDHQWMVPAEKEVQDICNQLKKKDEQQNQENQIIPEF
tara:strand:+ start:183 stop:296 length:114 start_codon:yes stop_codon:yes gene_type:complete